jgi:hypothetical protein
MIRVWSITCSTNQTILTWKTAVCICQSTRRLHRCGKQPAWCSDWVLSSLTQFTHLLLFVCQSILLFTFTINRKAREWRAGSELYPAVHFVSTCKGMLMRVLKGATCVTCNLYICFTTGWAVRESNPGGGEIFRPRPDRPCGPPRLLYNEYRVLFLVV